MINPLFRGAVEMEESVTYQAIIEKGVAIGETKGRREEARRNVLLLGESRFGPAGADVRAAIEAVSDLDRLEQLLLRVQHVSNWQELVGS
jgi:hypothetical protein